VHELSDGVALASYAWREEHGRLNEARAAAALAGDAERVFDRARRAWKSLSADCRKGRADPERTARIEAALEEEDVARALVRALSR
jgi:hypothetical protein